MEKGFAGSADQTYAETTVEVPPGHYTVIVFNELRNQIDYVNMRGHENLSTFEAYVTPSLSAYNTNSRAWGEVMVNQPGELAVWKGELTITKEMVTRTRNKSITRSPDAETRALDEVIYSLTDLYPLLKTTRVNMVAQIKNLNYARMPALVELRNMAEGYRFATDQNTLVPVTTQFTMNNRSYLPGSNTEGTIRTTINTFGLPGNRTLTSDLEQPIYNDYLFKLVDAAQTLEARSYDLTPSITVYVAPNLSVTLNIHLVFPTPLPIVLPEGSSGMDANVVEWEGEQIYIDLGKLK